MAQIIAERCQHGGGRWEASYALANSYSNGAEKVGLHSDGLTSLGPRPLVAGLSLGAQRPFQLKPRPGSPGGERWKGVEVLLPHNSLLIMKPGTMEYWLHGLPAVGPARVGHHPMAGLHRISLTFRMERPGVAARAPQCDCGRRSWLKVRHTTIHFLLSHVIMSYSERINFTMAGSVRGGKILSCTLPV